MRSFNRNCRICIPFLAATLALLLSVQCFAQSSGPPEGQALYDALKNFELQSKASVSNLSLKRDRGEMTFSGDFYFTAPINGKVTGAVFIGKGTFLAEAPPIPFEKENLKRFLDEEKVESDFETAVLRFTDDTYEAITAGASASPATVPGNALDLAKDLEPRLLEETGANISSRLAVSLSNNESPGFFLAQFDKGNLKRFTFMVDPQCRVPNFNFNINAGEKILVFRYDSYAYSNDIWIATYSEEDFANNRVSYSDDFDIVDPKHYKMEVDLTKARSSLKTKMRIDFKSLTDNLRAVPMIINENITAFDNKRLNDSMEVQSAQYKGQDIPCIQEDWESGLTFLLPEPIAKGDEFSVELSMEGDFIDNQQQFQNSHYPQGNSSWYPRHGFNKRSTFELTFRHTKADLVSSVGDLVRESEEWPDDPGDRLTEYKMETPARFVSFVAGILEHYKRKRKLEFGDMMINFYSLPTSADLDTVKEDFMLTELGNVINLFSEKYGPYPYSDFRATFRSVGASQPFATMVTLPKMDEADRNSFRGIGRETSEQWWGCIVTMRSYRDQWLSAGLAEYSGLLYVLLRMNNLKEQKEFLDVMRYNLKEPPKTDTGIGKGKVGEIGPMILGQRLRTRNTMNSGQMITNKGALVIRMLHYLFSNPSNGEDSKFYEMLQDFTDTFAFREASTDDFIAIANKHFPNTPIAQAFSLKDLNWFFQQWLYQAVLPSYRMEYRVEKGEGNQAIVRGKVIQENAPDNWFMPLPVVFKFPGDQKAQSLVYVNGAETAFEQALPMKPDSVELDPDWWILSEKTETKKK